MSPPPPRWERTPDFAASFGDSPMAEGLQVYWDAALEPYWAALRPALEEEQSRQRRMIVARGWSAMLRNVDGRFYWKPPLLATPHQEDIHFTVQTDVVRLVPMVFGGGWALFTTLPTGVVSLSYPLPAAPHFQICPSAPRGVDTTPTKDPLAILVGSRRAELLRALRSPATTSSLAVTLGIAPSTTSQHLHDLLDAKVVRRRRVGYEVHYELDRAGFALLKEFS